MKEQYKIYRKLIAAKRTKKGMTGLIGTDLISYRYSLLYGGSRGYPYLNLWERDELFSAPISDRFTAFALAVREPLSNISTRQRCEFSPVLNAEFHPLSIHLIIRNGL